MREEDPAVLGQLGARAPPGEQAHTEGRFEGGDPLGDGLLADAQADRGLAEVAVLGDGDERPDRGQIQIRRTCMHNRRL
ncbi:hypothetical protein LUX33_28225 [Actinomadura madurae]|nr:hypothetical protein [Actinomadura madurae]MCP9951939.1 hypothetical protein [Actinomadura madurae]MCP9981184.1 hypothetical protein [Actinomadura madurae]